MIRSFAVLFLLSALALPGSAQTVAERYLVQLANEHRAEHGLAPLAWDAALARAAHNHAIRILRSPYSIEHQYPGEPDLTNRAAQAGAHFSTVAENLSGNSPDVAGIDQAWMASPHHRTNILDPQLTSIGIAVLPRNGVLYAVEDFSRLTPGLTGNEIEQRVLELLQARGILLNGSRDAAADARRSCDSSNDLITHPTLIIQWDGPDLAQLPAAVFKQSPHAAGHIAALASCPKQKQADASGQPFTTYHVAILLY